MSASRDMSAKPIEAADEERRRVARELHDDIGQRLALLADDADQLRRNLTLDNYEERRRLDSLVDQARALSDDLRRISHQLHPGIVDDLGLIKAIQSLASDFADRTGMAIQFIGCEIPHNLPPEASTALYRIAQEALRNVAKHAGTAAVQLQLNYVSGELVLVVSDSGEGFETTDEPGLGLTSMRERAQLAGGRFSIRSARQKGTMVRVNLPFTNGHSSGSFIE